MTIRNLVCTATTTCLLLRTWLHYAEFVTEVQVSDTTADDSSNEVGRQKI